MASADLDAEIAKSQAHALDVTKTDSGFLLSVPAQQFGPFELMWQAAVSVNCSTVTDPSEGRDDASKVFPLAQTGDAVPPFQAVGLVAVAAGAVACGAAVRKRSHRQ